MIFTDLGGTRDPVTIVKDVLRNIDTVDDLLRKTDTEEAKLCITYAKHIITILEKPLASDLKFVEWLVTTLTETVGTKPGSNVWTKFHQLRSTEYSGNSTWRAAICPKNHYFTSMSP